jgi:hypothetical protein
MTELIEVNTPLHSSEELYDDNLNAEFEQLTQLPEQEFIHLGNKMSAELDSDPITVYPDGFGVLAVLDIPATISSHARMVVGKNEDGDFFVSGLKDFNDNNRKTGEDSFKPVLFKNQKGNRLTVGRDGIKLTNVLNPEATKDFDSSSEAVESLTADFGINTSRNHFNLSIIDGNLFVVDESKYGTNVIKNVSPVKESIPEYTPPIYEDSAIELSAKERRAERLFSPVGQASKEPVSYDYLFDGSPLNGSAERAAVRPSAREKVTEETKQKAVYRLRMAAERDNYLASTLRDYSTKKSIFETADLTEAIRTDKDLRLELGKYLLDKMESIRYDMPNRLREKNAQKRPSIDGYEIPGLSSLEYSVLLALSMIDGTFDDDRARSDPIKIDQKTGEVITGQHRVAAEKLLSIF